MLSSRYRDAEALRQIEAETPHGPLVQIAGHRAAPAKATLQGTEIAAGQNLAEAIDEAFDYRGDITIRLKSGDRIEGYIFDRDAAAAKIRMMVKPDGRKLALSYAEIERVAFTGRDMADGRSWEAWVRKYAERKAAGETNIELVPEAID